MFSKQRVTLLLIPAFVALLVSLLVHAPARLLAHVMPPDLAVQDWGGTVFNGQLDAQFQQQPVYLAWHLQPLRLLLLSLGAEVTVQGVVQSHAVVSYSPLSWSVTLNDLVLSHEAASLFSNDSRLPAWTGRDLKFARAKSGEWTAGEGLMQSPGGPTRLSLQGQIYELNLPPSTIRWQLVKGDLVGQLQQQADRGALATVTLTANHRIQWQIRDRMLRLKTGYTSRNDPDLVVLTVAEPL